MKHHGVRASKENLANWVSLALKKALTTSNIQNGFRGAGIWPLNLVAMKLKMGPNEVFKRQSATKFNSKEEQINEIMDEGLPSPPTNPTHYHVDSLEAHAKIDVDVEEEDIEGDLDAPTNIGTFLRMPQEVITRMNTRVEPIVDYSKSQILTLDGHLDNLHNIQQRKEKLA